MVSFDVFIMCTSKLLTTGRKRGYKTLEIPVFMRVSGYWRVEEINR